MNRPIALASVFIALLLALSVGGCAPEQEPAAPLPVAPAEAEPPETGQSLPADLYSRIESYESWKPAPDFAEPAPAKGPHGEQVRIFLDPAAEDGYFKAAASSASGGHTWPERSIIVKEILAGGEVIQLAAMEKTADGWYWGEWSAEGDPVVEEGVGTEPCEGCHSQGGTDGTLGVLLAP
ncbi:MAG: hypothetical protein U1E26_09675 [Coriobacteriia bacterium]|nr:hypothetical protein [Coriobacteriia bacterium]